MGRKMFTHTYIHTQKTHHILYSDGIQWLVHLALESNKLVFVTREIIFFLCLKRHWENISAKKKVTATYGLWNSVTKTGPLKGIASSSPASRAGPHALLGRNCRRNLNLHAQLLSCVQLFVTPWTVVLQAPLTTGFSSQEYWSGLPFCPPGNFPNPEFELESFAFPALAGGFFTTRTTCEALIWI